MKLWLRTSLLFIGVLVLTLIFSDLVFTYNIFNLRWEFHYYKWVIPCFCTAYYLTGKISSKSSALVSAIGMIMLFYGLELAFQYNFSGIIIDYVQPVSLWEMEKTKLMLYLKYELKPLPWFVAGIFGYLFSIGSKLIGKKKLDERNIYG